MANKSLRKLLIEIAEENEPSYIAQMLAYFYPRLHSLKKEDLFEFLHSRIESSDRVEVKDIEIHSEEISLEEFENLDLRIKSLEISNLRGIPDIDEEGIPFGMDFSKHDTIMNAIILANNGVGKSSVFAGLEMVFAQEIGEKQLRSIDQPNQSGFNDYLRRFGSKKPPKCKVITPNKVAELNNPIFNSEEIRRRFNPSNHFVSDFDIYHYGQINFAGDPNDKSSFHSIVANSLGLSDFIQFQEILKQVAFYKRNKESSNLKKLEQERDDKIRSIASIREQIESGKTELNSINSNAKPSTIINTNEDRLRNSLRKDLPSLLQKSEIEKLVENFKSAYSVYLGTDVNERRVLEKEFLSAAEKLIHDAENCPLCQNSNLSIEEIIALVENRLSKLKQSESEEHELKVSIKELFEGLNQVFKDSSEILEDLSKEKEIIRSKVGLNKLLELEEKFYLDFTPLLADEEMIEYVNATSGKSGYSANEIEQIYQFLNGPIIKDIGLIVEQLNQTKNIRRELAAKWLEKDSTKSESTSSRKTELELEMKRLNLQLKENLSALERVLAEIELAKTLSARVDLVKSEVVGYLTLLDSKIAKVVLESFEPLKEVVESVINDYLIETKLRFEINIEDRPVQGEEVTKKVIVAQIINKETGEAITPDIYFNTFRYKLLGLMISFSLALATRRKYKINLPLVLDDLFASSDFVSKNSFPIFLIKVIQLFKKYTPELPLQLILFTHDDLIFRGAIEAIFNPFNSDGALNLLDHNELYNSTKFGRMFSPFDKPDTTSENDEGNKYWNLLFDLETQINELNDVHGIK